MKEATGELSMTAVAVVAIIAVGALISAFVIPNMKASLERKTLCTGAYDCDMTACATTGTMKCTVDKTTKDAAGKETVTPTKDYACPCTD